MNIRAKFMLQEHRRFSWDGKHFSHTFVFRPQYDPSIPEDPRYNRATPSGEMTLTVDNPAVVECWANQMGQQFYLDFTPAADDAV